MKDTYYFMSANKSWSNIVLGIYSISTWSGLYASRVLGIILYFILTSRGKISCEKKAGIPYSFGNRKAYK